MPIRVDEIKSSCTNLKFPVIAKTGISLCLQPFVFWAELPHGIYCGFVQASYIPTIQYRIYAPSKPTPHQAITTLASSFPFFIIHTQIHLHVFINKQIHVQSAMKSTAAAPTNDT